MPCWEATNSETITPIIASVIEIFIPPKMCGSALGMRIFQNTCQGDAMKVRAMRWISSSMDRKPSAELMVMGKKATRKASNKQDTVPVPNQTMKRGAMEIFGTTCETTMIG